MAIFGTEILSEKERKFREVYKKYYAPFCLYARHFVADREEREDIVSDTFAKMWDRADVIDMDSFALVAYIKLAVRNACLNHLRHRNYETGLNSVERLTVPVYEEDAESVYTLEELYRLLDETLAKLPESHRKIFLKTYFEGMKQEDIARELNISVKTVGRYKQRTLEFLKSELKDFLPLLFILLYN